MIMRGGTLLLNPMETYPSRTGTHSKTIPRLIIEHSEDHRALWVLVLQGHSSEHGGSGGETHYPGKDQNHRPPDRRGPKMKFSRAGIVVIGQE
jgi:hypothetical protein